MKKSRSNNANKSQDVTREELEDALRDFVDQTTGDLNKAKKVGMAGAGVAGAAAVAAAFIAGKKRGEKEDETYVEVQRIS